MENRKSIDLDLERRDFEASGICTESMFENVMWDQWQFKYVPLVREKKICDNAIKINDRFLGWNAAKATPEGFVLIGRECPDPFFADNLFADLKTRSFIYDGEEFINLCDIDPIVVWKMVIEAQEEQSHD